MCGQIFDTYNLRWVKAIISNRNFINEASFPRSKTSFGYYGTPIAF